MGSSLCRGALALLVALSLAGGALVPRLSAPPALALDAALTTCDWSTFEARLAEVQGDGGGVLVLDCAGPIVFEATQTISTDVTLLGNGVTALDGAGARKLFEVDVSGRLTLIDLTVQHALTSDFGGAIRNHGILEVRNSTFRENQGRWGGGIVNDSDGTLTVISSTFSDNTATSDGGAIHSSGSLMVVDSMFNNNDAGATTGSGQGGAIYSSSSALPNIPTVWGSTFTDNEASRGGALVVGPGAILIVSSSFSLNSARLGGAIDAGSNSILQVDSSSFDDNDATELGGAIHASFQATLAVVGSEFTLNSSASDGGAIACYGGACLVNASTFVGNEGEDGGAIYNSINGTLDIEDSYFHDNHARSDGGAAYTFDLLVVDGSTFDANTSAERGGALFGGDHMQIRRNTFYANSSASGGALYHLEVHSAIYDSTFADNTAATGSTLVHLEGDLRITNTIIIDDTGADDCVLSNAATITVGSPNLVDDESCGQHGDEQVDANLGPLADNGGPTPTLMPSAPSDAIDAGNCLTAFDEDQRSALRPDTGCDIGAVEAGAIPRIKRLTILQSGLITEGQPIKLAVTAFGRDNDDLVMRYDCDSIGGPDTDIPCVFPDEGDYHIGVLVCAGTAANDCAGSGVQITVHNALPDLTVATSPAAQGVTLTAQANDAGGANDPLTYSFDCDGDGLFEVTGASNQTTCPLAPNQATATFTVLVADDDGGVAFKRVVVSQQVTACASRMTGALSAPSGAGACPPGSVSLTLPSANPTTLCISRYTGALTWSPRGTCGAGFQVHVVPDDGPLNYCQSLFTGQLRYSSNGLCGTYERAGVIPA